MPTPEASPLSAAVPGESMLTWLMVDGAVRPLSQIPGALSLVWMFRWLRTKL